LFERTLEQMVKVVEVIIERFNVPALALGFTVPAQVDRLQRETTFGQGRGDHFAITPTIFADPVKDRDDGARRILGGPLAVNQPGTLGAQAPENPRLMD
jgi:hypothetical protein